MDAHSAFDDVFGPPKEPVNFTKFAGATLRTLKRRQLQPVQVRVDILDNDPTAWTFRPGTMVIGADKDVPEGDTPLYDSIRKRFHTAIGRPKLVRLDDDVSYTKFRAKRRQPHLANLDARIAKLERAFAGHVADHRDFGDDVMAFERHLETGQSPAGRVEYEQAVTSIVAEAMRGGKPVNLKFPAAMRGKVECWLDGDEVLLSARLPSGIATTGTMLSDYFEDVAGCAEDVGCYGEDSLLLAAKLAPPICGLKLLGDLCRAAPTLSLVGETFVGALVPAADAGFAAMMALLQRCQQGDRQACREAFRLASGPGYDLVVAAGERLTHAQRQKAHVVGMDAREFGVNFFGGAHTGGKIILTAFGAGALADQLTELEKPALPGWAGGTADAKAPGAPMPPPPTPKVATQMVIVVSPDNVAIVHKNGVTDTIAGPLTVGVLGGTRFAGNGYKKGDANKFSFGFDTPTSVVVSFKDSKRKKTTDTDVKLVMFQGGSEQSPITVGEM